MKSHPKPASKTVEALKETPNLVCAAGAVVGCLALMHPVFLIGVAVVEGAYLAVAPRTNWYDRRLSARYDKATRKRREELKTKYLKNLSPELRSRFGHLELLRSTIAGQGFQERWYRSVARKLDYLLEKFLLFGAKDVEFVHYLRSIQDELNVSKPMPTSADQITEDEWVRSTLALIKEAYGKHVTEIEESLDVEQNPHNQAILTKRCEVVNRRSQYVDRIAEILLNIGHQLMLVEDTFGLINDEIRARSPEQMLADIDDVVFQTDNLTDALQEIAPFETVGAG